MMLTPAERQQASEALVADRTDLLRRLTALSAHVESALGTGMLDGYEAGDEPWRAARQDELTMTLPGIPGWTVLRGDRERIILRRGLPKDEAQAIAYALNLVESEKASELTRR